MYARTSLSRRHVLKTLGGVAALSSLGGCRTLGPEAVAPFRDIVPLDDAAVHLPPAFTARRLATSGTPMTDGLFVPMYPSGIGVFEGSEGTVEMLVSHDLPPGLASRSGPFGFQNHLFRDGEGPPVYDPGTESDKPAYGSVTHVTYGLSGRRVRQTALRLGGLLSAACGGATPHGTWLCGEATVSDPDARYARPHGYVFEVPLDGRPQRRPALGRFAHAGLAVAADGTVYQSEARPDGLLYRFVPEAPGRLDAGRLQALALPEGTDLAANRGPLSARWVDLADASLADDLRHRGAAAGATPIPNAGALCLDGPDLLVALPEAGAGRLWRLRLGDGRLALDAEADPAVAPSLFTDLTVAPWGDLLAAGTAADGHPTLFGLARDGALYPVVRSARADAQIAGPAFSPDGSTLFLNLHEAGQTLAVFGPWPHLA